jgi:peptide/nickel transport system permease protein
MEASPSQVEQVRHQLGLDRPIVFQYLDFLGQVLRGDLGTSVRQNAPVRNILAAALPATVELALAALVLALVIAIPVGIISAVRQNSWVDHLTMVLALIGVSTPIFWLGILLILLFSLVWPILPPFGRGQPLVDTVGILLRSGNAAPLADSVKHLALPAIALGMNAMGLIARVTRASMLEVLGQDYVRTARSKGLWSVQVIVGHVLPNALLPVITIVGVQFGQLLGGAVITETIFSWPGLGRVVVQAINQRDFPLVQGSVLVFALAFSVVNLCVDLSYAYDNPRIRFGNAG